MKVIKIKNTGFAESDLRLDASYHLSDGPLTKLKLAKSPYNLTSLSIECSRIFSGNIFKRLFVEGIEFGWPYLTGSDMVNADITNGKYISKKYTSQADNLRIRKEWILISCSGTLGNCIFTSEEFEGKVGTHDLIRVIPNEKNVLKGYLYAYLASKYGYGLLTQSSYGGVIKHIEPHHIEDLPIPIIKYTKQQEINTLIIESTSLRVGANTMLQEAIESFKDLQIGHKYGSSACQSISIKSISSGYKRFDSSYAIVGKKVNDSLRKAGLNFKTIRSQTSGIFIGPRSKRNYVDFGVPFLSTSAMQKANPTKTEKFIGKKSSEGFIVEEGWLLTTRSGTLGDTVYTLPCFSGYAVSEDAIRIVIKQESELSKEYIYAFLKSELGRSSLLSGSYGSVIQHLNEDYIADIKVPVLDPKKIRFIEEKITQHIHDLNQAILMENKAIKLVEKEIESWQK